MDDEVERLWEEFESVVDINDPVDYLSSCVLVDVDGFLAVVANCGIVPGSHELENL